MTAPYRTPGEREEIVSRLTSKWQKMHVAPWRRNAACPMCDRNNHVSFVACSPDDRLGWLSRCDVGGVHLHHQCGDCGMKWIAMMPTEAAP